MPRPVASRFAIIIVRVLIAVQGLLEVDVGGLAAPTTQISDPSAGTSWLDALVINGHADGSASVQWDSMRRICAALQLNCTRVAAVHVGEPFANGFGRCGVRHLPADRARRQLLGSKLAHRDALALVASGTVGGPATFIFEDDVALPNQPIAATVAQLQAFTAEALATGADYALAGHCGGVLCMHVRTAVSHMRLQWSERARYFLNLAPSS